MSKELFAFVKGWQQVAQGDVRKCRKELMEALKIKTRAAFLNRLNGEIEPRISEVKAIEQVFNKYGIKDVWGK